MNQILIVDDEPQNCHDIAAMLAELDVSILYCHQGENAISHIRDRNPSLVLLDSEMPSVNGYQVINQMWSDDDLRQVPVLLMTAHFADRKQLLHQPLLEVVDSLPKPLNPVLLVERVKMALTLRGHQQTIIGMLDDGGQAMRKRHEGVLAVDSNGRITFANATALALLRTNHQMIFGVYLESIFEEPNHFVNSSWAEHPIQKVCAQGNVLQVEACNLHCADGNTINVRMAAIPMDSESELSLTIAFRQVAAPKDDGAQEPALHLNHYDPLTGVFHRQAFEQLIDDRIKRREGNETKLAIIQVDLTHFNHVNETLGHEVGDRMLKDVVSRIQKSLRPIDRVARIGGDVFAVMVEDAPDPSAAGAVAQKLIDALTECFLLEGFELYIGASIGIASFPECGKESGALLKNAAIAVEGAKLIGMNNFQYFTAKMNDEMLARVELETALRHAFERDEIEAVIEPLRCEVMSTRLNSDDNLFTLVLTWSHPRFGCKTHDLLSLFDRHGALDLYSEILFGVIGQFVMGAPKGAALVVPVSLRLLMSESVFKPLEDVLAKGRSEMILWMVEEEGLGRALTRQKSGACVLASNALRLGLRARGNGYFADALTQLNIEFLITSGRGDPSPKAVKIQQAMTELARDLDIAVLTDTAHAAQV